MAELMQCDSPEVEPFVDQAEPNQWPVENIIALLAIDQDVGFDDIWRTELEFIVNSYNKDLYNEHRHKAEYVLNKVKMNMDKINSNFPPDEKMKLFKFQPINLKPTEVIERTDSMKK